VAAVDRDQPWFAPWCASPKTSGAPLIAVGDAGVPPSDTLTVTRGVSSGDVDELQFVWDSSSTTGTMILRWSGDLIAELTVDFN
jgi:hypothetical protein